MKTAAFRWWRRMVPPPHRPLRWTAVIPLLAFAAVMALMIWSWIPTILIHGSSPQRWSNVTWVDLSWLSQAGLPFPAWEVVRELEFTRPWALLLLLVTPWIWWMQAAGHAGLPPRRAAWAGFVRLMLCGLLILVLAEPRAVRTSDVVAVVYNVDVSDSVNAMRNEALELVATTAARKPGTDHAGLVVFGRTAAVEYPPRESFPFEKYINSQVSQDATNIEQSLALSAAMLPEEHLGRILLVSDGTETVGQLKDIIDDLQARNVQVSVVPIEYNYDREVLLERLDLPRLVRLGETYDATIVLNSLAAGRGTLVLQDGENEIARQEIEFSAGKSRYSIPITVAQPGYYEYTARIEVDPQQDHRPENNTVRNYLYLEGPGRVLIVVDPADDLSQWTPLVTALRQGERQVDLLTALEFPYDPLSLMPYDAVIFADVPADLMLVNQVQALHDAIRNLGIGFLMTGGPDSFGPGGWQGSPLEDALPVSMEISKKKVLPKGALAIILHTCEFPQGNSWAKRITKKAIEVLNAEDLVGALAQTENGDEWLFELTPAGNYDELVPKINGANIGDMATFGNTMTMGLEALVASDAASRHMIIISDGDASPPTPGLLKKFIENQVSVSTVAVFPHDGDTFILEEIAGQTGGRFYYPSDPNELPKIFIKEAKTLRREQIQQRDFVPMIMNVDPLLRDIEESPQLHGYVLTSPKDDPRATIVLAAPPTESEAAAGDPDTDPILAVWRYGLGVTAAFTSDLSEKYWGRDWVAWSQYQQLVNQLLTRIARTRKEQYLRVYTYVNGNEGVVVVEDFHPEETLLDMTVSVTGPNDFSQSQPIRQIAPRRYQTSLPLKGEGRYQVMVGATNGVREEKAYAGFIVSYSPEYLRFSANPIVLRDIARSTGGEELDLSGSPEDISRQLYGNRQPRRSSRPIFDWYLMVIALLLPLDVAVRRVQWDGTWLRNLFRKRAGESTATIGVLLARTTDLRSALNARRDAGGRMAPEAPTEGKPLVPRPAARPAARVPSPPQASVAEPVTPAVQEPASDEGGTTSRLLALKRKRESDGTQHK